jgi:hypothetical protein
VPAGPLDSFPRRWRESGASVVGLEAAAVATLVTASDTIEVQKRDITMSGPIVRTGATPEFWENWDKIFGDKGKKSTGKKKAGAKASKKSAKKKSSKKK